MSVNLLDFNAKSLAGFCNEIGEKPFRAKQLLRWIHRFWRGGFCGHERLGEGIARKAF